MAMNLEDEIANEMAKNFPDFDGVLHFNDGYKGRELNTLVVEGRKYFDRFDHKKEFRKVALGMISEDAKFMYIRDEDPTKITFQEMPTDYCIIDSSFPYG
jgi:hypothetical protein